LDVIKLNEIISGYSNWEITTFNQLHKPYDKKAIMSMLMHQQKNNGIIPNWQIIIN